MATQGPVILKGDEYTLRPLIIAWLAYPRTESKRRVALRAIQNLARNRVGLPLLENEIGGRRQRTQNSLGAIERAVSRRLLAGEIFRRQVFSLLPDANCIFRDTSTRKFAQRVASHAERFELRNLSGFARSPISVSDGSAVRDLWSSGVPSLSLAVGSLAWWPPKGSTIQSWRHEPRPSLETLLFTDLEWASSALLEAEKFRRLAMDLGHKRAKDLIEFQSATF